MGFFRAHGYHLELNWCLTSTETIRFTRDGEKRETGYGGGGEGGGQREISQSWLPIPLVTWCTRQAP